MSVLDVIGTTSGLLQQVWTLANKLKDSHDAIDKVENSTRNASQELNRLKKQMLDPKSLLHHRKLDAEITSMLKEHMNENKVESKKARAILRSLEEKHWLGTKTFWVLTQVPKLEQIAVHIDSSRNHIARLITTFVQPNALQTLIKQVGDLKKALNVSKKEREKEMKILEIREKLILEKGPKAIEIASLDHESQVPRAWVQKMTADGVEENEAQKVVDAIVKDVRKIEGKKQRPEGNKQRPFDPQKVGSSKSAKDGAPDTGSSSKSKVQIPFSTKQNPEIITAKPPSSGLKTSPNTSFRRILCVDRDNGSRAIIAQIYLELLRSWTMNTEKRWLFSHVQSAGAHILTPFTSTHLQTPVSLQNPSTFLKSGSPLDQEAISTIANEPRFGPSDFPYEKTNIISRIKQEKTREIRITDFAYYDHILCFSDETMEFLKRLRGVARTEKNARPVKAKIYYLENCRWVPKEERGALSRAEFLKNIRGAVKNAIREHLKRYFVWTVPVMGIGQGKWRTFQKMAGHEKLKMVGGKGVVVGGGKWWGLWREFVARVEGETGCVVSLETVRISESRVLLSVSGPKDKLRWVMNTVVNQ